jgi:hypothetical protein
MVYIDELCRRSCVQKLPKYICQCLLHFNFLVLAEGSSEAKRRRGSTVVEWSRDRGREAQAMGSVLHPPRPRLVSRL